MSVLCQLVRPFTRPPYASRIGSNLSRSLRTASNRIGSAAPKAFERPKPDETDRPFVVPYIIKVGAEQSFGPLQEIKYEDPEEKWEIESIQFEGYREQWSSAVNQKKMRLHVDWQRASWDWTDDEEGDEDNVSADTLRARDCVLVKTDHLSHTNYNCLINPNRSLTKEPILPVWKELEPSVKYARIVRLFEKGGKEYAHIRWFAHGSETIMGEEASSKELYLLTCCEDIPLKHILKKIQVDKVTGPEHVDTSSFNSKNHFHYRMHYDPRNDVMEDACLHEYLEDHTLINGCECCTIIEKSEEFDRVKIVHTEGNKVSLRAKGITYREHDIVYMPGKNDNPQLHTIAQLLEMKEVTGRPDPTIEIRYRLLERFDELHEELDSQVLSIKDDRRLYYTMTKEVTRTLAANDLIVLDLNVFKDQDTHNFYIADTITDPRDQDKIAPTSLSTDAYNNHYIATRSEFEERMKAHSEDLQNPVSPLIGMSMYTGGGGLDIGLHQSLAVKTKWAIEWNTAALASYARNFPEVETFGCRADLLLKTALAKQNGGELLELELLASKLPEVGWVDIIYGGPPCQGFSGLNASKDPEAVNNAQILVYLSYVIHFKPKYFLLENVVGLLNQKKKDGKGIDSGTLKIIYRIAADHGYQIRFTLLEAGDYGLPSQRARVIFWGAKLGYKLPEFPQASHTQLETNQRKNRYTTHRIHEGAPHRAATIEDAISDLPLFEHEFPEVPEVPFTPERQKELDERQEEVTQYPVVKGPGGCYNTIGAKDQEYRSSPMSEYQRRSRTGASTLTNHISHSRQPGTIEKICHVRFGAGAGWRTIPKTLQSPAQEHELLKERKPSEKGQLKRQDNSYTRIDPKAQFAACCTVCRPSNSKTGAVLLPYQNRQMSIRENCRAQSFPDVYEFHEECTVGDMQRIVGNAVPPLLSRALGNKLYKVLSDKSTIEDAVMQKFRSTTTMTLNTEPKMEEAKKPLRQLFKDKAHAANFTSIEMETQMARRARLQGQTARSVSGRVQSDKELKKPRPRDVRGRYCLPENARD